MTTKALTGTYTIGYNVGSAYNAVTLTKTARIDGFGLLTGVAVNVTNYGTIVATDPGSYGVTTGSATKLVNKAGGYISGATGLVAAKASEAGGAGGTGVGPGFASTNNAGELFGGTGGVGGSSYTGAAPTAGGTGGKGGAGLYSSVVATVVNSGLVEGGEGGEGGYAGALLGAGAVSGGGGAGGYGVILGGAATIVNNGGDILGGFGGAVGGGATAGVGGAGGAGVLLVDGGYISATGGQIEGGQGAVGGEQFGAAGGTGGAGGAGVVLGTIGTIASGANITGGVGGAGALGTGSSQNGGNGGAGGAGVSAGNLTNRGTITGGVGGAGGVRQNAPTHGQYFGDGGVGGAGVVVNGYGYELSSFNYGTITGGDSGAGGAGVYGQSDSGGAGVQLVGDVALANYGSIVGGQGATEALGGHGVNLVGLGGVFTNRSFVEGSIGVCASASTGAYVENSGVIEGLSGVSVEFKSATDTLGVDPGSSFIGIAEGGGGLLYFHGGPVVASDTITGLGGVAQLSGSASGDFTQFGTYKVNNGDALTLTGSNALAAGVSLILDSGATLSAQGAIVGAGAIDLDPFGAATDLHILAAGATLSGGGTVTLGGSAVEIVGASATATLTNVSDTLSGVGAIGAGSLTLINDAAGVIEAVGAGELVVDTNNQPLTNAGLIEAVTGGTLIVSVTEIVQSGAGSILAAGGRVYLENDLVLGGAVGSTGSGLVEVNVTGSELNGLSQPLTLGGVVDTLNGVTLSLVGAIDITGKLELNATSKLSELFIAAAGGGLTLTGAGQIDLSNSADNIIVGQTAATTLTNVDDHIVGAGLVGDGTLTLVNDKAGIIDGNGTVALTLNTGSKVITNIGTIEAVGKGGVVVDSAVNNTGKLYADGGTLTLKGAVTGAGLGYINSGTLDAVGAFTENVDFLGTKGVLELAHSLAYKGKITGLSKTGTNSLDLLDIAFGTKTKATYSGTTTSGTLTVTDGTHTAKITLEGNYTASTFKVSSDGHGGTKVIDPTAPGAAHAFITAMAGFGAHGAAAQTASPGPWRTQPGNLAAPHTQIA